MLCFVEQRCGGERRLRYHADEDNEVVLEPSFEATVVACHCPGNSEAVVGRRKIFDVANFLRFGEVPDVRAF